MIKSDYIGSAFFDASAAAFIMPSLLVRAADKGAGDAVAATAAALDRGNSDSNTSTESKSRLAGSAVTAQEMVEQSTCSGTVAAQFGDTNSHVAAEGYGLGPEWIAKSCLKACLAEKQKLQLLADQAIVQVNAIYTEN